VPRTALISGQGYFLQSSYFSLYEVNKASEGRQSTEISLDLVILQLSIVSKSLLVIVTKRPTSGHIIYSEFKNIYREFNIVRWIVKRYITIS
jgi:hypothetical protein